MKKTSALPAPPLLAALCAFTVFFLALGMQSLTSASSELQFYAQAVEVVDVTVWGMSHPDVVVLTEQSGLKWLKAPLELLINNQQKLDWFSSLHASLGSQMLPLR